MPGLAADSYLRTEVSSKAASSWGDSWGHSNTESHRTLSAAEVIAVEDVCKPALSISGHRQDGENENDE